MTNFVRLFNKRTTTLILVFGLIIIFQKLIEELFVEHIVNPILSKVESSLFIDIVCMGFLLIVISKLVKNIINRAYISLFQILFDLGVLTAYIYTRAFGEFDFQGLSFYDLIKYFDLIFAHFLISPLTALSMKFFKKKVKINTANRFYSDDAIKNKTQDFLSRHFKAQRLTKDILTARSEGSIAFGITGEWGSGKTSFLNLIKEEIAKQNRNEDILIIDFNPWLNLNVESIVEDFFDTVRSEIKPYSRDIYRDIKRYSNSLLKADKSRVLETISSVLGIVSDENLTSEFMSINTFLDKIGKRIIVCIDDFDRLQPKEIFEFLKLIRSSASFNNFTYLVAFDKSYLVESLEHLGIPKSKYFSEKIFLKEERLTPVTSAQVMSFIRKSLKSSLGEDESLREYFEKLDARILFKSSNYIPLRHIRDGKRFLNSFLTDYKSIQNEVDFHDYLNLKLLRYSFYDVYSALFLSKDRFLSLETGAKTLYKIKYESEDGLFNRFRDFQTSELGKYIRDSFGYNDDEINNVGRLLNDLFDNNNYSPKNHLSIASPKNYHKYFIDNLNDDDLSESEFLEVLNSDFESIKNSIDQWHSENKTTNVRYRFQDLEVREIRNKEVYENMIKAIIYLAKLRVEDTFSRKTYFGYDYTDLAYKIKDREGIISRRFYNEENSLKGFLKGLFNLAQSPYLVEMDLLNHMYSDFDQSLYVFSQDEIKDYLIKYFKEFLKKNDDFGKDAWLLFHNCNVKKWHGEGNGPFSSERFYFDEAKDIMKEFMKKDLDRILVDFVEVQSFYGNTEGDSKIGISNGIKNIFESFEDFLNFLEDKNFVESLKKPSDFREEFLDFGNRLKVNEFKMIDFEFKYPPVLAKLEEIKKQYNR